MRVGYIKKLNFGMAQLGALKPHVHELLSDALYQSNDKRTLEVRKAVKKIHSNYIHGELKRDELQNLYLDKYSRIPVMAELPLENEQIVRLGVNLGQELTTDVLNRIAAKVAKLHDADIALVIKRKRLEKSNKKISVDTQPNLARKYTDIAALEELKNF